MAGFTNYLEDKIMNHLFGDDTGASGADHYTAPTTWYVGLLTAAPSDSAAGTEAPGLQAMQGEPIQNIQDWMTPKERARKEFEEDWERHIMEQQWQEIMAFARAARKNLKRKRP